MSKKNFRILTFISFFAILFACSCSSDEESNTSTSSKNDNKNVHANKYVVNNLEFPKVKGGTSKVIVYTGKASDEKTYGMNFAVEWDCTKKSQRWSCYRFDTSNRKTGKRKDNSSVVRWYPSDSQYPGNIYGDLKDPNRKYPFDYKNLESSEMIGDYYISPFDHGHICPSADRLYTQEANIETFYMTNMQPQYAQFNEDGIWYLMEGQTRKYANNLASKDTLYIVKGGTIDSEENIIQRLNNQLIVPKYFYVAYLMWHPMNGSTDRNDSSNYKAMAFWFLHENKTVATVDWKDYMISIDELEKKTGIDFFCNLPDAVENVIESKLSPAAW